MSTIPGPTIETADDRSAPKYVKVADWARPLLSLRRQDVADVAVDSQGMVYLLYRYPSELVICDADGVLQAIWGQDVFSHRPHGVLAVNGRVFVVDEGAHCIRVFDGSGRQLTQFGTGPSNPAFAAEPYPPNMETHIANIARGYPPFTRPTRLSVAANGDLFISDGYGNARVHHFTADGEFLHSWGEPGTGPGEFHIPHAVFVDAEGRVLVCDRENDRIQVFDADGQFVEIWTDFHRPQAIGQSPDGLFCVAEGSYRLDHVSQVHGPVADAASRVSVCGPHGEVLQRIGGESPSLPGQFIAAHAIATYPEGFYVAEVSVSVAKKTGDLVDPCNVVQKFRRIA